VKAASPSLDAPFKWRDEDGVRWIEASLPGATAAFTTRVGGVSQGAYAELNLGILTDDDPDSVARNRELVAAALARDPQGFAMGLQVHGNVVQVHESRPQPSAYVTRGTDLADADGHLTRRADVTPLVLVADCVPLVMAVPGAVAAVHCGWRGVVAGIVGEALESLRALAETEPAGVSAAIGPGIGACCYEVGEEVIAIFRKGEMDEAIKGSHLDISTAVRLELERAGVDTADITSVDICTSCNPDLFFSHRRDGPTGRQAGIAWLL
jgi:YfiH family protein